MYPQHCQWRSWCNMARFGAVAALPAPGWAEPQLSFIISSFPLLTQAGTTAPLTRETHKTLTFHKIFLKRSLKFPFETNWKNQIYLNSTLKLLFNADTNNIFKRISGCWLYRNHDKHVIKLLKNEADISACHMIYEMLSRKSWEIKADSLKASDSQEEIISLA